MPSENLLMLMTVGSTLTDRRSVSPMTPSPSQQIRGLRLFRAISRKLARKSNESINSNAADGDSRSSSSDSSTSTKKGDNCSRDSGFRSVSPNPMSSSSSETGSDNQIRPRHHHSSSAESIRKVFQNLSLNSSRSRSCNNTKEAKRKSSKKPAPKKILRSPVTYTYVKGLSGLPTQRIPKNQTKVCNTNPSGCGVQYMSGLNR